MEKASRVNTVHPIVSEIRYQRNLFGLSYLRRHAHRGQIETAPEPSFETTSERRMEKASRVNTVHPIVSEIRYQRNLFGLSYLRRQPEDGPQSPHCKNDLGFEAPQPILKRR